MALIDPAKMIKVVIKGWNKSEEYYIKDFDTAVEELKKIVEKKEDYVLESVLFVWPKPKEDRSLNINSKLATISEKLDKLATLAEEFVKFQKHQEKKR